MLSRRLGLVRSAAAAALRASELHTTAASAGTFKKWRNSDSSSRAVADTGKFRQWRHRNLDGVADGAAADVSRPISGASKGRVPGVMAPWRGLSRAENQEIDRFAIEELAMPSLLLMENAGLGLTAAVVDELEAMAAPPGALIGIVVGPGNNGGDGLVLSRQLPLRGYRVEVAFCGARPAASSTPSDAAVNLAIAERSGLAIANAMDGDGLRDVLRRWDDAGAVLLVDSLFGTGLQGTLSDEISSLISAINAAPQPVIAADLPSGLDCDTGLPLGKGTAERQCGDGAVIAVRTATNGARKTGFDNPSSLRFTGPVTVVSLGCPALAWAHGCN